MGDLVYLAPLVMAKTGWRSTQWHATVKLDLAGQQDAPPPMANLFNTHIIIDIPGSQHFCRHCDDVVHSKASYRQGQCMHARFPAPRPHDLLRARRAP